MSRALLIASQSKQFEMAEHNSSNFIIASGSEVIPLFWFTLFTSHDIFYFDYLLKDGSNIKTPRLVINFETGFERLCRRQKLFIKLLPPKLVYLYDKWAFLIQDIDTNYLHIDINGLLFNIQDFKNYDIYVHQISTIIDNLLDSNSMNIIKEFIGIEFKRTIFSKKIITPNNLHDITALLCGSSWLNDKPWESYF